MKIRNIAMVVHQVNKAYCQSIGDNSQVDFKMAPKWQQNSIINGVKEVLNSKCKITPQELHEHWCADKIKDGWIYGPEKDLDKKTHPSLATYESLSTVEKAKDLLFIAVVKSLAKFLD